MEDTININKKSPAATFGQKAKQPSPLVLALVLTSILYVVVKQPFSNTSVAVSHSSQASAALSTSVENAVMQDLSQRSGLPKSALRIVEAKQLTWQNGCLEKSSSPSLCRNALVPGWQIIVASGKQRWVYRTDTAGVVIKFEQNNSGEKQNNPAIAIAGNIIF